MVRGEYPNNGIMLMDKRNRQAGSEAGANAIEYGLIAALVAVVVIGGLAALGSSRENKTTMIASTVEPAAPRSSGDDPTLTPIASTTFTVTPETRDETSTGTSTSERTTPTPDEEGPRVLADTLCWLGPGSAYDVVSALRVGTSVEVLGVGWGGSWLIVVHPQFPDVTCWVPIEAVELPDPVVLPDKVFSIPPTPTSTPEPEKSEGCIMNSKCVVPCPNPGPQYPVCYK